MDILEVLSSAALELSDPRSKEGKKQRVPVTPLIRECKEELDNGTENWREIVRKRIAGKTRRFTKGPSQAPPQPVANRFGPVAGLFFYPLLEKYDSCCTTMNMMGEDHLVLGRLISSLAVVMHAAANTPAARQMAVALMEFVWALRYHVERFVRHSLLHAICMVMCSLPPAILLSDLQAEIIETQEWLQDVLCHDYDGKTQELALQTAALLESVLKVCVFVRLENLI
jgi:telomere length regulation protein